MFWDSTGITRGHEKFIKRKKKKDLYDTSIVYHRDWAVVGVEECVE